MLLIYARGGKCGREAEPWYSQKRGKVFPCRSQNRGSGALSLYGFRTARWDRVRRFFDARTKKWLSNREWADDIDVRESPSRAYR